MRTDSSENNRGLAGDNLRYVEWFNQRNRGRLCWRHYDIQMENVRRQSSCEAYEEQ